MTDFPLYKTLSMNLPDKKLTIAQTSSLLKIIPTLEQEAQELVYILIKCYALERKDCDAFTLPYDAKFSKNKIDFDLDNFPNQLCQLLYKFVKIHDKKILEDKEIKNLQKTNEAD